MVIEPDDPDWTEQQRQALQQLDLFNTEPPEELEKIPFKFTYEFDCMDAACNGHKMICTDWEMNELYRKVKRSGGDDWEALFRQRYEREMLEKNDTYFFVGTLHLYPAVRIIVGVFYPPPQKQGWLFEPRNRTP